MYLNTDDDLIEAGDYVGLYILHGEDQAGRRSRECREARALGQHRAQDRGRIHAEDRPSRPRRRRFPHLPRKSDLRRRNPMLRGPQRGSRSRPPSPRGSEAISTISRPLFTGTNFADPKNGYAKYIDVAVVHRSQPAEYAGDERRRASPEHAPSQDPRRQTRNGPAVGLRSRAGLHGRPGRQRAELARDRRRDRLP